MSKQAPPAPTASAEGRFPAIIQIVGRPEFALVFSFILTSSHQSAINFILLMKYMNSLK